MMDRREHQVGASRRAIRADHWARYSFAAKHVKPGHIVLDALCGVGYGSHILAGAKPRAVYAFDRSKEAIEYAQRHWSEPAINYRIMDYGDFDYPSHLFDLVTCFEAIEHIDGALGLLASFSLSMKEGGYLLVSSPNELRQPWSHQRYPYHKRHYTPAELEALLNQCGFKVTNWVSQSSKQAGRFFQQGAEGAIMMAIARKQ